MRNNNNSNIIEMSGYGNHYVTKPIRYAIADSQAIALKIQKSIISEAESALENLERIGRDVTSSFAEGNEDFLLHKVIELPDEKEVDRSQEEEVISRLVNVTNSAKEKIRTSLNRDFEVFSPSNAKINTSKTVPLHDAYFSFNSMKSSIEKSISEITKQIKEEVSEIDHGVEKNLTLKTAGVLDHHFNSVTQAINGSAKIKGMLKGISLYIDDYKNNTRPISRAFKLGILAIKYPFSKYARSQLKLRKWLLRKQKNSKDLRGINALLAEFENKEPDERKVVFMLKKLGDIMNLPSKFSRNLGNSDLDKMIKGCVDKVNSTINKMSKIGKSVYNKTDEWSDFFERSYNILSGEPEYMKEGFSAYLNNMTSSQKEGLPIGMYNILSKVISGLDKKSKAPFYKKGMNSVAQLVSDFQSSASNLSSKKKYQIETLDEILASAIKFRNEVRRTLNRESLHDASTNILDCIENDLHRKINSFYDISNNIAEEMEHYPFKSKEELLNTINVLIKSYVPTKETEVTPGKFPDYAKSSFKRAILDITDSKFDNADRLVKAIDRYNHLVQKRNGGQLIRNLRPSVINNDVNSIKDIIDGNVLEAQRHADNVRRKKEKLTNYLTEFYHEMSDDIARKKRTSKMHKDLATSKYRRAEAARTRGRQQQPQRNTQRQQQNSALHAVGYRSA